MKTRHETLQQCRVDPETGCWIWHGAKGRMEYGWASGDTAHRSSYREYVGPIPEGLHVLHHCDNYACINPAHLYVGTYADNARDRVERGRARGGSSKGEANPMFGIKGPLHPLFGIPRSEETKAKIAATKIGPLNAMFGIPRSEEVKARISDTQRRRYAAMREAKEGRYAAKQEAKES